MFFVYDTETSGFPKDIPYDHPSQARIVQLAFVVLDEHLKEVMSYKSLIKPNGKWTIPSVVQEIHGFDDAHCQKFGVDLKVAMESFNAARLNCKHEVAHNHQFDKRMIKIESSHVGSLMLSSTPLNEICTMQLTTPICKLPNANGRSGYKWPKLSEAYEYVTKQKLQKAHDALADVRGCISVLKWLIDNRQLIV